ncbi:putative 6-pyruvoyl tetrahydropterin synthase [Gracilibacillus halophilus YIM-C55.5]|uniref:6-carboxy-5,6,7,8-tetrahydropterin synthase n=1 Tax=Gracilibacillus halophilus YIM-C55.5 TaxID=1308866 RepID=N4WN38_9BACI|nr:6-carboxytetrahydropterin synthase [Gracilibacillus halophilus]ENH97542.1 putative 6-pyruvoyl tetrahydropterin synthase [Gracilibacillus halophilus YIM-C55.5]
MLYLSRRIDFSAMHHYRIDAWTEEQNRRIFGLCSNPNGHGHDYQLEVMVRGQLNPDYGVVVNTTDIKASVGEYVREELDGKYLNKEHPYFMKHVPTTEQLVTFLWQGIEPKLTNCELYRLRLHENPYIVAEKGDEHMVRLTRKYHFSAAHRLHSEQLSEQENQYFFGKCNNPYGHGHNYYLEVTVCGEPDPITGMITDLAELDATVDQVILEKMDHKHLNLDVAEFRDVNPTSEVVAKVIYDMLSPYISNLDKVGLWETEKNYFEYAGEEVDV